MSKDRQFERKHLGLLALVTNGTRYRETDTLSICAEDSRKPLVKNLNIYRYHYYYYLLCC